MAGEAARVGLADMPDAKREQEPVEGDGPAGVDRVEQIPDRRFAEAFPVLERRAALRRRGRGA